MTVPLIVGPRDRVGDPLGVGCPERAVWPALIVVDAPDAGFLLSCSCNHSHGFSNRPSIYLAVRPGAADRAGARQSHPHGGLGQGTSREQGFADRATWLGPSHLAPCGELAPWPAIPQSRPPSHAWRECRMVTPIEPVHRIRTLVDVSPAPVAAGEYHGDRAYALRTCFHSPMKWRSSGVQDSVRNCRNIFASDRRRNLAKWDGWWMASSSIKIPPFTGSGLECFTELGCWTVIHLPA